MCHLIIIVLIILKNESTEQNLNVYKMVRRHQLRVGFGGYSRQTVVSFRLSGWSSLCRRSKSL